MVAGRHTQQSRRSNQKRPSPPAQISEKVSAVQRRSQEAPLFVAPDKVPAVPGNASASHDGVKDLTAVPSRVANRGFSDDSSLLLAS